MTDDLYDDFKIFTDTMNLKTGPAIREAMNDWICIQACDEEVAQKIRDKFGHDKELIERILGE